MRKHSKIKREVIDTYIVFSNSDEKVKILLYLKMKMESQE
jgi:hypothetical protein